MLFVNPRSIQSEFIEYTQLYRSRCEPARSVMKFDGQQWVETVFAILYGIVWGQEMLVCKIHGPFGPVRKSSVGP